MLSLSPSKPSKRKCVICKAPTLKPMAAVCSVDCAIQKLARDKEKEADKRARAERKELKARKEAIKPRAKWLKEVEAVVNRYVRLRDAYYDRPCISCDRGPNWNGQWHASHFKSVGSNSALRYNLWNIHRSCSICNNHLSGNIGAYTERLPGRIGAERFEWLKTQNQPTSYSIECLKRMKAVFAKKCKRMQQRIEANHGI